MTVGVDTEGDIPKWLRAVAHGLRNALSIHGRTSRRDYWYFAATILVAWWVFLWTIWPPSPQLLWTGQLIVAGIGWNACVRRLHDLDKSGWHIFLVLIPVVGAIILLVWFCRQGTPGPNRFGPDPLKQPARIVASLPDNPGVYRLSFQN